MFHCYMCQETKPRDAFHRDSGRSTGLSSVCKPCANRKKKDRHKVRMASDEDYRRRVRMKEARKRRGKSGVAAPVLGRVHTCEPPSWYRPKAPVLGPRHTVSVATTRERNRLAVAHYLSENPCVDCGESDIDVLQFDHREMLNDSTAPRVSQLIRKASLERVFAEIALCDVRCASCHQIRTREQLTGRPPKNASSEPSRSAQDRYLRGKAIADAAKSSGCVVCGDARLGALQFDHIEPLRRGSTGLDRAHSVGRFYQASEKTLGAEIAKCRVVCANCHFRHTREQMGYPRYSDLLPR